MSVYPFTPMLDKAFTLHLSGLDAFQALLSALSWCSLSSLFSLSELCAYKRKTEPKVLRLVLTETHYRARLPLTLRSPFRATLS